MRDSVGNNVIIGGGLAGYFLAANLVKAGRTVTLIHNPNNVGASGVSAGLVNPLTGRQYVLTWKAMEFLEALDNFLKDPLFTPLAVHYHRVPVYRPFPDIYSSNEWVGKTAWPGYENLTEVEYNPWRPELLVNPHGGMIHLRSGWLDIPAFLQTLNQILSGTGLFTEIKAQLAYESISPNTQEILIEGMTHHYSNLIFCEGIQARNNPWFGVNIIPLKGQVLSIESEGNSERIVSSGVFMIPLSNNEYRLGSTYERDYQEEGPDEWGKNELLTEAKRWWIPPIHRVLKHDAGLRPTTLDRMPILGRHESFPNLWIFNGLGAKGVLQGPGLARLLSQAILEDTDSLLWDEIRHTRKKALL